MRFVNGHFRYCCRLGLIDNTLLGLAKPKQQKSVFECRTLPRECYLYMIHAIGIAIVGAVFMPIQVRLYLEMRVGQEALAINIDIVFYRKTKSKDVLS